MESQAESNVLMVRQPIFNRALKIVAYQLRYQQSDDLADTIFDSDTEGSLLLMHTFTSLCQDGRVCKVPLFIPFPMAMLEEGQPLLIPKDEVVIEISSSIKPTPVVIKHLKQLRKQGFQLALDSFSMQPHLLPIVKLMNVVKVDFSLIERQKIPRLLKVLRQAKVLSMAQNVADFESLKRCNRQGFKMFQGPFISRPSRVLGNEMPGNTAALLKLVNQLQRPDITPQEIEELIIMDPKLSFRILKVVNSAAYQLVQPIDSMQQAVVMLGQDQIRKWAMLISLAGNSDKPEEVPRNLLVRGRMCELLSEYTAKGKPDSAFMVGMISQLDILLDVEMSVVLEQIPLDDSIKAAISEGEGELGAILEGVVSHEQGDWYSLQQMKIDQKFLDVAYRHSLQWTEYAMQALSEIE